MNLNIVFQNSNHLFKTLILYKFYLINENNEHCIMNDIGN